MIDPNCYGNEQELSRLLMLEAENTRLQFLVAELLMKNQVLRERLYSAENNRPSLEVLHSD